MTEKMISASSCGKSDGSLPGSCAPLAFPYIPMQESTEGAYDQGAGLENGTLFPGLNLPFYAAIRSKVKLANNQLTELMALDFAIQELVLYMDTHKNDQQALQLLQSYIKLAKEGRAKYQKLYGPLTSSELSSGGYDWLKDPWPWDLEGGEG